MSAKKRPPNQAEARRPQAVPTAPAPQPAKKPILKWLLTGVVGLAIVFLLYKRFIEKPYVKPISERVPPPIEKTNWESLIDGARAMQSVERLLGIGPRVAGTEGSTRAQEMIKAELGAAGVTQIREQKWSEETPKEGHRDDCQERTLHLPVAGRVHGVPQAPGQQQ